MKELPVKSISGGFGAVSSRGRGPVSVSAAGGGVGAGSSSSLQSEAPRSPFADPVSSSAPCEKTVAWIAKDVAEALSHLHQQGILHCDVSGGQAYEKA